MSAALSPASQIVTRPLDASFGAELFGSGVADDAPAADVEAFMAALHRHHVVLIRDVPNDPAAQVAFSRRLGPLELHSGTTHTHPAHPEIFCVGNYEAEGIRANFATGVEQWHADSSFRAVPSAASLFYGAICPPEGGETWFLDAQAAYDDLDAATKARIDGLGRGARPRHALRLECPAHAGAGADLGGDAAENSRPCRSRWSAPIR